MSQCIFWPAPFSDSAEASEYKKCETESISDFIVKCSCPSTVEGFFAVITVPQPSTTTAAATNSTDVINSTSAADHQSETTASSSIDDQESTNMNDVRNNWINRELKSLRIRRAPNYNLLCRIPK